MKYRKEETSDCFQLQRPLSPNSYAETLIALLSSHWLWKPVYIIQLLLASVSSFLKWEY